MPTKRQTALDTIIKDLKLSLNQTIDQQIVQQSKPKEEESKKDTDSINPYNEFKSEITMTGD